MKYTKLEIDKIIEDAIVIVDTREKVNFHILNYFDKCGIKYIRETLKVGDYTLKINLSGKEIVVPLRIERKNSVNELVGNFNHRSRFENEFKKAKKADIKMILMVEELNGYSNILLGNYRSEFKPRALDHSLKAFEARYNFTTHFLDKKYAAHFIYSTLLFHAKEVIYSVEK